MKLAFVGNQDNNAYRLCKGVRQAGHDAHLFLFQQEQGPRSRPELVDPQLAQAGGTRPDWVHEYDDRRGRLSLLMGSPLARKIESEFDLVVTSGATGLLAVRQFRRRSVLHLSLGSEVGDFPWRTFNRHWPLSWWGVGMLARRNLRRTRKVITNYSREIQSLSRLGLQDKVVIWGHPEDVQGNRDRVDQALLAELNRKYAAHDAVFLWLSRINYRDPRSLHYKGCDRFLGAFERVVRQGRFNVRAIIGTHGDDAAAFDELIQRKQLGDFLDRVPHMPYYQLLTHARIANGVMCDHVRSDAGAFGGVTREALSVGTMVITGMDREMVCLSYGEAPPVFDAQDETACHAAMIEILSLSPQERTLRREANLLWAQRCLDYAPRVREFLRVCRELVYCSWASRQAPNLPS